MKSKIISFALRVMPKRTYTYLLGTIANTHLSRICIPWYVRHFDIQEDELEMPIQMYETLGAFFTRRLAAGVRPIEELITSPVDGTVSSVGFLDGETLLQVKGVNYSLTSLLQDDEQVLAPYRDGQYITLYLSPKDYHRIHAPMECDAVRSVHIPGTLFPVNRQGVQQIQGLFAKNERIITYFTSSYGNFAMVKVGAAGVGTVRVPFDLDVSRVHPSRARIRVVACDMKFAHGAEIGHFSLGSTVVLLFPKSFPVEWAVSTGDSVQMGQQIALFHDKTGH